MFCKWCGKIIQTTDKECPACGRETPPMSDCGGFYNLKHSNSATPTTIPEPAPPEPVVVMQCPIVEKIAPQYDRDRKRAKIHHMMAMIGFVIVLGAIVCSAVLVMGMNSQLDEIKGLMVGIQSQATTAPADDIENETDVNHQAIDTIEPVPYMFTLGVTVKNTEDTEISTTYDFGNYAQVAKVMVDCSEKGQNISILPIIDGEETAIKLALAYRQDELGNLIIGAKCDTDLALFDTQIFTYEWQYRNNNGTWTTAEEDLILQDDHGYVCFVCGIDWLENVCISLQLVELRCNIRIENDYGDSMLLTVDGFSIDPYDTAATDNQ